MKIACFGYPHVGGTYSVYKSLREGLSSHGIAVRWLGIGAGAGAVCTNSLWSEEWQHGEAIALDDASPKDQAQAVINHLHASKYDAVFVNVLADPVLTNIVRYLDPSIPRIMIVHSITPGTYAAAKAVRDYVHAAVGVSPRIASDLVTKLGFRKDNVRAIPNAVDIRRFKGLKRISSKKGPLRMISLGRIENASKGSFWLPQIMQKLDDLDVRLTIAGGGPDLSRLRELCLPLGDRVSFLGSIPPAQVPALLAEHDLYLFPSRFEGLGISLVEAMVSGCVPVASQIYGVTDFVISHGENGMLFPVGDTASAAMCIRKLETDRALLKKMALQVGKGINDMFAQEVMARSYADLIHDLTAGSSALVKVLPMESWSFPTGLRPGLRSYLPSGLKNQLRVLRERWARFA